MWVVLLLCGYRKGCEHGPGNNTQARKVIHGLLLALSCLALATAFVVFCPCPQGVLWLSSSVTKNYFPQIYDFGLTHSICSPNLGSIGEKSIRKLVSCQVGVRLEA